MAARAADLVIRAILDYTNVKKGLVDLVALAKQAAAQIKDELVIAVKPDINAIKAAAGDALRAAKKDSTRPRSGDTGSPKQVPSQPQPKPNPPPEQEPAAAPPPKTKPSPGPTPEPEPAGPKENFGDRLKQQEAEFERVREQYRGRTRSEQRKLTNELVDEIDRLMNEKRKAVNAAIGLTDKQAKAEAAAAKQALDAQLGTLRRVAASQKEVINEGAGAKVGIMGLFRKVGDIGGGAFQANQIMQSVGLISNAVQSLSAPFQAFDKSIRDIGALGVKNFGEFKGAVLDFSKTVPDSASDIASAIGEAVGSGVVSVDEAGNANVKQGIEFAQTASQLAIAGGSSIGKSVSGIAAVLNAYGLSADHAGAISDKMFNIFNLGVTSVDELANYLSQVTPVAAAAGVNFDQIGAAIATMTKQGIKTPDATTKIRALLVEMQKPMPALKKVLDESGVSIDKIKSGEISLQQAAGAIGNTITAMGKSAPQVFSSIEAATTVLALSGKNASTALSDLEGISQRGTVAQGFAVQADGAEVRMKTLVNNVNAAFIGMFDTLGNGFNATLGAAAQIAPTLSTLATLKAVIPDEAMAKMKDGFLDGLDLLKKFPAAAAASGGGLKGMGGALTSLFNPAALWMAGIAAAIGLLVLLYNKSEAFRNIVDKIGSVVSNVFVSIYDTLAPIFTNLFDLVGELGAFIIQWLVTPWELGFAAVSAVISVIGALISLIPGIGDAGASAGSAFTTFFNGIRIAVAAVSGAVAGLTATLTSIVDSVKGVFSALGEGDLGGAWDAFTGAGEKAGDAFVSSVQEKVGAEIAEIKLEAGAKALEEQMQIKGDLDKAGRIEELKKRWASATTEAEKNSLAEQIAKQVPGAVASVKTVVDQTTGEITKTYDIAGAKLDEYTAKLRGAGAEGSNERQLAVVEGLKVQAQQYDENVKKLDEFNQKLAEQKAAGIDTTETEKGIKELEGKVKEGGAKLRDDLKNANSAGMFDSMSPEAEKVFGEIREKYGETVLKPMEQEAANAKLGDVLGEAARLKGDLDSAGKVEELVEKFKNAKTEAERNSLARALDAQVPGVVSSVGLIVDANGKIQETLDVNVEKATAYAAAQKLSASGEIQSKQKAYIEGLKSQANALADNRERAEALAAKIADGAKRGQDVSALRGEYDKLRVKITDGAAALATSYDKGKKFGLIQGDVSQVGKQFAFTKRETDATTLAVKTLEGGIKNAAGEASNLAEEFRKAQKEASTAANDAVAEAAQLVINLRNDKLSEIERKAFEQRLAEVRRNAVESVKNSKDLAKVLEAEEIRAGLKKAEVKKKSGRVEDQTDEERLKQLQLRQERELKLIDNDLLKSVVAADQKLVLRQKQHEKEMRDLRRQIAEQDKTTQEGRNKAAALQRDFEAKKDTFAIEEANLTLDRGLVLKDAQEKIGIEVLKIQDELFVKETERRRAQTEAMQEVDERSTVLRGLALMDGLRREKESKIKELLNGNAEFQEVAKAAAAEQIKAVVDAQLAAAEKSRELGDAEEELSEAEQKLREGKLTEAQVQAVRDRYSKIQTEVTEANDRFAESQDALNTVLTEARERFLSFNVDPNSKLGKELAVLVTQFDQKIQQQTDDNLRRARTAAARDRIKIEKDTAVQERQTKMLEVDEALVQEIKANERNQAKITQLITDAESKRRQIFSDSLRQSNFLFSALMSVRDAIREKFDKKEEKAADDKKKKAKDDYDKEVRDLENQRARNLISYADYISKIAELDAKRRESEQKADEEAAKQKDKWREAGILATQKIVEEGERRLTETTERFVSIRTEGSIARQKRENAIRDDLVKQGIDHEEATRRAGLASDQEISDTRVALYTDMTATLFARTAEALANGEAFFKATGRAIISAAFDLLQAQIPIWVASIWGIELGTKGLLGVPAAAATAAILLGITSGVRAALGYEKGGLVEGGKRMVWINEAGREFVTNAETVNAGDNLEALEWSNRTKRPLREFFSAEISGTYVDARGELKKMLRDELASIMPLGLPEIGRIIASTSFESIAGPRIPQVNLRSIIMPLPSNLSVTTDGQLVGNPDFHEMMSATLTRHSLGVETMEAMRATLERSARVQEQMLAEMGKHRKVSEASRDALASIDEKTPEETTPKGGPTRSEIEAMTARYHHSQAGR